MKDHKIFYLKGIVMKELIKNIRENSISHGSIPFWSWNDKLEPEELRRQIRVMHKLKMNGFFMHARGGLETEYLSNEWFECIDACIDEAKKLGMEAWSYDENGWPSGFAGGILLEDPYNHACYITHSEHTEFPAEDNILAVYSLEGNKLCRTEMDNGSKKYIAVHIGYDPTYVDTLDGTVTDKFIKATHELYKEKISSEDFGTAMPGFFTDEPQYFRYGTPYSKIIPAEFKNKYGYDVLDMLAALFIDCEGDKEFRYDYYYLIHELFMQNFAKRIYDWCEENNIQLTGHAVEEAFLAGQMWCCGGVMPFYQYEHIPGIDYLSRGVGNVISPKQIGSASAQLGRKKVISEMFACCGWDVSPKELKKIADLQYAGGVNMMCQHLYAYSERGQRKRDYPAHYSEHLQWQDEMAKFNEFYNNLGYVLSLGEEFANVCVIHPIHSCYLNYKRREDTATVADIEGKLVELSNLLSSNQVQYHYADESMLAKLGGTENGRLSLGFCDYDYVIIPYCHTLDGTTADILKKYIADGGKVLVYDKCPDRIDGRPADLSWLRSNITMEDIMNSRPMVLTAQDGGNVPGVRLRIRDTDYGRIFYLTNITENKYRFTATCGGCLAVSEVDMADLSVKPVHGVSEIDCPVELYFEGASSCVLVENNSAKMLSPKTLKLPGERIPLGDFTFDTLPENILTLDNVSYSLDGESYSTVRSIYAVKDMLFHKRYAGKLYLRYPFNAEFVPEKLRVCVEKMKYADVLVNGSKITLEDVPYFDKGTYTADIAPLVKVGQNEITLVIDYFQRDYVYYVLFGGVSESLRNCLAFDTEIESIYLYGAFAVRTDGSFEACPKNAFRYNGEFVLTKQRSEIDVTNIIKDGYPFYAGKITVSTVYDYKKGMPTELYVTGRRAVCNASVNGVPAADMMFSDHADISAYLKEGENVITLTLCNSCRNMMGPHHRHDPEPFGVGPYTFSFEKEWDSEGEVCPAYVPGYAFVRFGIDK